MKTRNLLMGVCTVINLAATSNSNAAAMSGLTESEAEAEVIKQAHVFIGEAAPESGGSVHSPCRVVSNGSSYTVICKGATNEAVNSNKSHKAQFSCEGDFSYSGLYYQDGPVQCALLSELTAGQTDLIGARISESALPPNRNCPPLPLPCPPVRCTPHDPCYQN